MPDEEAVLDSRFETVAEDVEHLLSVMDVDELEDLAMFLMVLLARPVVVDAVWDEEAGAYCLEVVLSGHDHAVGTSFSFPISALALVRESAAAAHDLGPYDATTAQEAPADLVTLERRELITTLQQALGSVRLLALFDDD